jgi:DNA repair photolyase
MLFDDSPPTQLVGIAKLAAQSPALEHKVRVEYLELETRQFVGRCSGTRMPFVWTINPYRGCEFGCKYCYARYAHEFMELRDPLQFERRIFAKRFSPAAFKDECSKIKAGESVWIGTATDPYQPAERRFRITRQILEVFAEAGGQTLGLTTKSDLVARDADLLGSIGRTNKLCVNMTVTTTDAKLARLLEPMAPRPDLRLQAVRTLADSGVRVHVLANPVMPLITDSEANLEAVCRAAAQAGAKSFSASPLFLKPCSKQVFLPFVQQHFPHLYTRYRDRYERQAYLTGAYPEKVAVLVQKLVAKYRLAARDADYDPPEWPAGQQLQLRFT